MKTPKTSKKEIIGVIETVKIKGKKYLARIDTGARRSSICISLLNKLKLGSSSGAIEVRSSTGKTIRPLIKIEFELKGKKILTEFTVINRMHMQYSVLIGRNALKTGFLIDPAKK